MIQQLPLPSEWLRQQVARLQPWVAQASWSPLYGGRTNAAWTAEDDTRQVVLKLYRAPTGNPLFPNDPKAEAQMLTHLSDMGVAPQLIASFDSDEGHCLLYHAIPGQRWQEGVEDVAKMMRDLHQQPYPKDLRSVASGSIALFAQAQAITALCTDREGLALPDHIADVGRCDRPVLLHCDIVPGNLIRNDKGLHLIDWQCPGIGDPCEDMAVFLSPAMQTLYRGHALSPQEQEAFLAAYPEHKDRYLALAPGFHLRMAAYCQWQVEQGNPDYALGKEAELSALKALGRA